MPSRRQRDRRPVLTALSVRLKIIAENVIREHYTESTWAHNYALSSSCQHSAGAYVTHSESSVTRSSKYYYNRHVYVTVSFIIRVSSYYAPTSVGPDDIIK